MPSLKFCSKAYKIYNDQSLIICNVTGDTNFHFAIRFIQKNSQRINLEQFESDLSKHLVIRRIRDSLCFIDENKLAILNYLKNLGIDPNTTEIIQKKTLYKVKDSKLTKSYDKNSIHLFCLDSVGNCKFGYEISENLSLDSSPLACIQLFSNERLSKKIYLFPTNSKSLTNAALISINDSDDLKNLEFPYVEYIPSKSSPNSNYDKEIQTRINLQSIISEILTHLEKPKCFRKNGTKKAEIFRNLAMSIANNEGLNNIYSKLNEHDTWKILAQHRDPWGCFSFFKGKTHSLLAWQALRVEISNFSNSTYTPAISN